MDLHSLLIGLGLALGWVLILWVVLLTIFEVYKYVEGKDQDDIFD